MADSDNFDNTEKDPTQLDLGLGESASSDEKQDPNDAQSKSSREDNQYFRQERSILLANPLFTLDPDRRSSVVSKTDDSEQIASVVYTTSIAIKDAVISYHHPPLGPSEQRLIHGLMYLASGRTRGTSWTFETNDSSPAGKWTWKQFGDDAKQFGETVMLISTSRREVTEAMLLGRQSTKSINARDLSDMMKSLRLLKQVQVSVVSKDARGREREHSTSLISHFERDVDDTLKIALNPRIMNAVMGIEGSYSLLAIDDLKSFSGSAIRLLYSRLCGYVDHGKTVTLSEEKIETYLWRVSPLPNTPENKETIKGRRKTIRRAMKELMDCGWECTLEGGTKKLPARWVITRPARKKALPSPDAPPPPSADPAPPGSSEAPPKPQRRGRYTKKPAS